MGGPTMPPPERAKEDNKQRPPHRTFRFREHTIGPDRRPEAEPITFTMCCATCEATGPVSTDAEDGTTWAVLHLKKNTDHLDYREQVTRSYRAEPGAWL